jgi:SSS family transporter
LWIDAVGEDRVGVPAVQMDFVQNTKNVSWIDWSVIGVYFIIVACIGTVFARKQTNADSFALGSRNVKWWASGISMMATGVSTISFMAVPALVACIGMASQGPIIFMLIGILISAFVTYPLLRRLNITSTFEYVENRYGLGLRLFGSFNSIIVQMLGRIGVVVMLPALAISTMTGIDPWISVLVMGILTTLYSTAGGFEAVIWTDVVQGLLMLAGFAAIGILAFMNIEGGMSAFIEFSSRMDRLNFFITTWDLRVPMLWFAVFGFILQFMAFASDQATAQRVLAIPMKDVRKLAFLAGGFSILIAYMSGAVGMGLFGFFKTNPEYLSPVMKNDQMVPLFIVSKIPVGLSGLLLATLFAASMSTISSSVNVCAVLFGEDFYKRFNKKASGKSEMRVMQLISMLSGLVGTGIALFLLTMDMPTLWESFMRIMAYVGGGYVGIYILGMFTRRTHELGAIIGVITSFGVAYFVNNAELGVHWSGLSVVVVSSCVVTGYVSSLVIPWKRKDLAGLTVWDQIKEEPK